MTHIHEFSDLDHDLDPLGDYESQTALCFSCGQPVDRNGVATVLNAKSCFFCAEDI